MVVDADTGAVAQRLELLVGECTCMRSPSTLGTDIPMAWDEGLDAAVVLLRERKSMGRLGSSTPVAETSGLPFEGRVVAAVVWTMGGLVVVVIVAAILILRYRRRIDTSQTGS